MARQVDYRKQKIAGLGGGVALLTRSDRRFDLVRLLADLCQHRHRIVPVEADLASLHLQLERAGEGRERNRNTRKRTGRFAGVLVRALARLFFALDALPQLLDVLRREPAGIAEHVRVTSQELLCDRVHYVAEVERAALLRDARM